VTRLATHAAAAAAGALLALLLTSTATSRQPSASRPAPAAAPQPSAFTPFAGLAQTAAPTLRPAPSHSTWKRPARTEALTAVQPPSAHRPRSPQPAQGQRSGVATWFAAPAGTAAAGPALRAALGRNWRGTAVTVTANGHAVRVRLTDWMRADKLVDLNPAAFRATCGALSRGVCRVSVTW
jgi:hypothetical protein